MQCNMYDAVLSAATGQDSILWKVVNQKLFSQDPETQAAAAEDLRVWNFESLPVLSRA